uniref:Uncharacterized protein n=1 Tax=Plectus sambesii TaxID=2011161 RepID=A0A914WKD4_9BILA
MPIEYGRFGSPPRKKKTTRVEKPRQEISRVLKYLVFTLNFAFLVFFDRVSLCGLIECAQLQKRGVGIVRGVDSLWSPRSTAAAVFFFAVDVVVVVLSVG